MNTIEIPELNIKKEYPSSFEEMNQEQFLFTIEKWLAFSENKLDFFEFQTSILYQFLGIERIDQKSLNLVEKENKTSNLYLLAQSLDFIVNRTKEGIEFNYKGVQNLIPKLQIGSQLFLGPQHALTNLSFREYKAAFANFIKYRKTKDIDFLNNLVAILYKSKENRNRFFRLKRTELFEIEISNRKKHLNSLSFSVKYAIALFFNNCNQFFKNAVIDVEGTQVDLSIVFESNKVDEQQENQGLGLTGLMYDLAEDKTFGDVDGVLDTNLYDVFLKLYHEKIKILNMKSDDK